MSVVRDALARYPSHIKTIVAKQDKREFGILRDERFDAAIHKDIMRANGLDRTRIEDKKRYARSRWKRPLNKVGWLSR